VGGTGTGIEEVYNRSLVYCSVLTEVVKIHDMSFQNSVIKGNIFAFGPTRRAVHTGTGPKGEPPDALPRAVLYVTRAFLGGRWAEVPLLIKRYY
jgi:hypothetical protein